MQNTLFASLLLSTAVIACGPNTRDNLGDDDGVDAAACVPSATTETSCAGGGDEDCDGAFDCADLDCAAEPGCEAANCAVESPTAMLSLPDGNCTIFPAPPPTAPEAEMQAFLDSCGGYDGLLPLTGFPAGARLNDPSMLLGVCVNMEHTWLRDLQMELYCPDGNRVRLSKFLGQDCPNPLAACEVFMGVPNESDGGPPGTGWDYCWRTTATNPSMLDFSNANGSPQTLPAGDYLPSDTFDALAGCALNGTWKIRVVDAWGIDDGYIFESKLEFDAALSDECPVIE
jgi:hypothetical protein